MKEREKREGRERKNSHKSIRRAPERRQYSYTYKQNEIIYLLIKRDIKSKRNEKLLLRTHK
jgi:hypothetical protein